MGEPYSQFPRRDRLPGEPFLPETTKRRRASRSFVFQFAAGLIVAALFGWYAAPVIEAWWDKAHRTPEQISAIEQSVYYAGCNDARAVGAAPLYRGQPGYRENMDGDADGIACEPYA